MPPGDRKSISHHAEDWQGFKLESVCWGYRSLFNEAIRGLFEQGLLGESYQKTTAQFFNFLKNAEKPFYDQVLKEFLAALNPEMSWIMTLPGIFTDLIKTGADLAATRLHLGSGFFKLLGEGSLGTTPESVRHAITLSQGLLSVHADLAFAFLKGYSQLSDRLSPAQIQHFIKQGLYFWDCGQEEAALVFLEGLSRQAEEIIRGLTRECRLKDQEYTLRALIMATCNKDCRLLPVNNLSLDKIIERGTRVVGLSDQLYLPFKVRYYSESSLNRDHYRLIALFHSATVQWDSFSIIHGKGHYRDSTVLTGDDVLRQNLLLILEYSRIIYRAARHWPGFVSLMRLGFETEYRTEPALCSADALMEKWAYSILDFFKDHEATPGKMGTRPRQKILFKQLASIENIYQTLNLVVKYPDWLKYWTEEYPDLGSNPLRVFSFISDFRFPIQPVNAQLDTRILQMRKRAGLGNPPDALEMMIDDPAHKEPQDAENQEEDEKAGNDYTLTRGQFIYDEWAQPLNDYYENYCQLYEITPECKVPHPRLAKDALEAGKTVRKVFENLRPALMHREKYLEAGDTINSNLLVDYLTLRRHEPTPKINFYEKPHLKRRDLAVLVLLDLSGSTSKKLGRRAIITIEREAAFILAEGLDALGDQFEIAGFSSKGREQNHYSIIKSFSQQWNQEALVRLHSVFPTNSTRMGTALRHAGHRMSEVDARTRLILLITDGRPMDADYDPNTRYAHFDVRRACEENLRRNINTYALSTDENTFADMEIMFPKRRFSILDDMRDLPRVLPNLYTRLTI